MQGKQDGVRLGRRWGARPRAIPIPLERATLARERACELTPPISVPRHGKSKTCRGGIHHAGHAKDGIGGGLETREPSATETTAETINNKLAIVAALVALFLASSLACLLKS